MEYTIYVGTLLSIKQGLMKGAFKLMYCGMPNENTFVLTPFIASHTYQGYSPSIYFNINSSTIQVFEKQFDVIGVNSEYIILGD